MSSDIALQQLTNKKGDELSKILKVDSKSLRISKTIYASSSYPDTSVIANIQSKINNPLFKLTIADYELMCGNKMLTKMMSKVLGCDEKHLKKFCKYINAFKDNFNSSPKTIKNKMKPKMTLDKLPDDMLRTIVKQYKTIFKIKYVLKDWIPIEKLNWRGLSSNSNAIDLLKENPTKIIWSLLSINRANEAIELLKKNPTKIVWEALSTNTNPEAIELLKANPTKIDWYILSGNPNAIELLKKNPENIVWQMLSANPNAIDLLKEKPEYIDWFFLSINTSPEAIELLRANPERIVWEALSTNTNPDAIELLKENPTKIDWKSLSRNPNAIDLLKGNYGNIDWNNLSKNTNAIELLKANHEKIVWRSLSENTAIFDEILV